MCPPPPPHRTPATRCETSQPEEHCGHPGASLGNSFCSTSPTASEAKAKQNSSTALVSRGASPASRSHRGRRRHARPPPRRRGSPEGCGGGASGEGRGPGSGWPPGLAERGRAGRSQLPEPAGEGGTDVVESSNFSSLCCKRLRPCPNSPPCPRYER